MSAPSTTQSVNVTVENPERVRGNFLRLSRADIRFASVLVAVFMLVDLSINQLAAFGSVLLGALLMKSVTYGRLYYVTGQWFKSRWIRHVLRGYVYRQDKRRLPGLGKPPIPLSLHRLTDTTGLIHNREERLDAIPIVADGSNIVSLGMMGQFESQQQIGNLIKRLASYIRGYGIGISFVFRRRPLNLAALDSHYQETLHQDVIVPPAQVEQKPLEAYTDYDWRVQNLRDNAAELLDVLHEHGGEVDMAMVLTVRREGALSSAQRGKSLAENKIHRLSASRIAAEAVRGLTACGVDNPRTLHPDELVEYLRASWDITGVQDFYYGDEVANPDLPAQWPRRYIRAYHDYCDIDGTLCGTIMFRGGPREAEPWYFRELYSANVRYPSIALVGEGMHNRSDLAVVSRSNQIAAKLSSILGFERKTASARQREEEREEREEQLNRTRFRETYHLLFGVANPDPERFEDEMDEVMSIGKNLGLNPLRITGECRVVRGYMSAATGVNML